jgi:dolichol-phosphate mannosyltransferase
VVVHMAVLWPILKLWGDNAFLTGQIVAAVVAMTANFFLNNALTYRDRRLKGVRQLFDGWVSFCVVCAVGLVANVGLAGFLHDYHYSGWALSALVGVLVGAVWNYALSSRFVWGRY